MHLSQNQDILEHLLYRMADLKPQARKLWTSSLQKKCGLEKIVVPVSEEAEFCISLHKMSSWSLMVGALTCSDFNILLYF